MTVYSAPFLYKKIIIIMNIGCTLKEDLRISFPEIKKVNLRTTSWQGCHSPFLVFLNLLFSCLKYNFADEKRLNAKKKTKKKLAIFHLRFSQTFIIFFCQILPRPISLKKGVRGDTKLWKKSQPTISVFQLTTSPNHLFLQKLRNFAYLLNESKKKTQTKQNLCMVGIFDIVS